MITIDKDWVVLVGRRNYVAARNKPIRSIDPQGKERITYPAKGYFKDLDNALQFILEEKTRKKLREHDYDLQEAIEGIRSTRKEFAALISNLLSDASENGDKNAEDAEDETVATINEAHEDNNDAEDHTDSVIDIKEEFEEDLLSEEGE